MGIQMEGFVFNDYCFQCQRITEHKILLEDKELSGACSSCGEKRALTEINQIHYQKTDLWVTRFKMGNLPSVVVGKLVDAVHRTRQT
jgi:hypothetical protein